jgi:hypothetical protein
MSPMPVVAFDVDLHRVHGYSDAGVRICYNVSEWPWQAIFDNELVLVEIASPVNTAKSDAEAYNRRKWAIGNALMIGRLMCVAEQRSMMDKILVSPANKWTLGHPEEIRDVVSGCAGEDNHDIRACRAMLHYHRTNPDKWVPIRAYYDSLSSKKGTR